MHTMMLAEGYERLVIWFTDIARAIYDLGFVEEDSFYHGAGKKLRGLSRRFPEYVAYSVFDSLLYLYSKSGTQCFASVYSKLRGLESYEYIKDMLRGFHEGEGKGRECSEEQFAHALLLLLAIKAFSGTEAVIEDANEAFTLLLRKIREHEATGIRAVIEDQLLHVYEGARRVVDALIPDEE